MNEDVFPIEHGDVIPACYVIVYQRVRGLSSSKFANEKNLRQEVPT